MLTFSEKRLSSGLGYAFQPIASPTAVVVGHAKSADVSLSLSYTENIQLWSSVISNYWEQLEEVIL